jgi:hypothetical protein
MIRFQNFVKEDWNEYLHPRVPKGKKGGGQFANKYIHYSDKPLNHLLDVPPEAQSENGMKPRGIWFGIGSSWKDWAATEFFGDIPTDVKNIYAAKFSLEKETAIVLKKNAKILRIKNAKQLDNFTKKYPGEDEYLKPVKNVEYGLGRMINWKRVTKDYDGIIIAPYIASRRLSVQTPWYYGWDVASGCVWNIDAIRILK